MRAIMTNYPIEIQKDLYKRVEYEMARYRQWSGVARQGWVANASHHLSCAICLLELLENVTVFHVGGGFNKEFGSTVEDRIKSFSHLKS